MNIFLNNSSAKRFSLISNVVRCRQISTKPWRKLLKYIEETVCYTLSSLHKQWLLTDVNINRMNSNSAMSNKVLEAVKKVSIDSDTLPYALIVLLISKTFASQNEALNKYMYDQKLLVQTAECIKTAIYFHNLIALNQDKQENSSEEHKKTKLALLIGDYFISKSHGLLAEIGNSEVEEIMCSSLRDLAQSNFLERRGRYEKLIPTNQDGIDFINEFRIEPLNIRKYMTTASNEWILRHTLGGGFLLGKSCMCASILLKQNELIRNSTYAFGLNLELAWCATRDLYAFESNASFPLRSISAPILFQTEKDEMCFDELELAERDLKEILWNGVGREKTEILKKEFCQNCLDALNNFPDNQINAKLRILVKNLNE